MTKAREYFDRARDFEAGAESVISINGKDEVTIQIKVALDFESGCKYVRIFIPDCELLPLIVAHCIKDIEQIISISDGIIVNIGMTGSGVESSSLDLDFSGRAIIWTPGMISDLDKEALYDLAKSVGLRLIIRDNTYVDARAKAERPLAFISHDSRDKDVVVRTLAAKLAAASCPVWYDEYDLKPGDSLRKSIEAGLKSCPKCIVVLSKNFFQNVGWAAREFDSMYTREIVNKEQVIIPLWLDVTPEEVYEYSPILADRVALVFNPANLDEIVRKLVVAVSS